MIHFDSDFGAIVKGYSDRGDICGTAGIFWEQMRASGVDIYLDRMTGTSSDAPSRGSWRMTAQHGSAMVPAAIPESLRILR